MTVRLKFSVPADTEFASQTPEQLATLRQQVVEAAKEFSALPVEDISDGDIDTMNELFALVQRIDSQAPAAPAASSAETRQDRAAAAFAQLTDAIDGPADEDEDAEDGEDPPATPPAPPSAVKAAKPKAPSVRTVAAAAGGGVKTDVAVPESARGKATLLAASNNGDMKAGAEVDWLTVAKAVERNFLSYQAGGTSSRRDPIAMIKLDYPEELTASGGLENDSSAILEYASNEKRLAGGSLLESLTAAGVGWAAPSEVLYQLCELESNDGVLDVPEITATRGGIKYTTGPDFASIFSGAGFFHYTEAQIITGVTKPTMLVTAPSFTDTRLEADGLAIQTDLLTLRGYPELIARFVRGAMVAHTHKLNMFCVNAMVTNSTALQLPSGVASHTPILATTVWGTDHSVASMVLSSLDLAITDYQYRSRMSMNSTIEVVLPYWVLSWIRSDVMRRAFYDGDGGVDQFAVTMAKIKDWLKARNARVQFIYDWQDAFYWAAYPSGAPSAWQQFGATTATTDFTQDWPHTVQALVYAAGTWTRVNEDIITLETVYDSTLLAQNKATQLFTEQGIAMAKTCYDSRVYTIAGGAGGLVPSGAANYAPSAQPVWTNP